ncbi:MAG: hypothetical protein M0031_13660 [Thermaerobacter sp.]|nr:hypothetical protein [Thermaerobacter sp.]
MNCLERALAELVDFLEAHGIPYMLIGGIANLVWGEARLTRDIDVTVLVEESEVAAFIAEVALRFRVLPPDPLPFVTETRVLPLGSAAGVRLDVVFAALPYETGAIGRAVPVSIGGVNCRVCTAEDLIIHKIISERPRDREDVVGVIRRQAGTLDRGYLDPIIRELSDALERPEWWEFYARCMGEPPDGGGGC